jgi:hypothetical protein
VAAVRPTRRGHWTTVLALVACGLLVSAGLVAGAQERDARPVGRSVARLGGCVPTGPLDTVDELNHFVVSAAGVPEFLGADIGVDVHLGDGRSLWLFGDTLRRTSSGVSFVRNSMVVFARGCARVVQPPGGTAVVPDRGDGVGYWPMSVWQAEGDDTTVYAMLQRVAEVTDDDNPGGFVTLGPSLATFRVSAGAPPQLISRIDLGADDPSPEKPEWGAASALDGGWLYLYGTSTRDLPGVHGFALRVARVRPDRVADLSQWSYWNGLGWTADPDDATAVISEQGGVSQTLSVWPDGGRWYVLSKQNEFLGHQVVVWPGGSPVGPFGSPHAVADIPCDPITGELRYMPLAHPALLPQPGTVVLSYSRNYADPDRVCAAPSRYRPYFLRVPLPS